MNVMSNSELKINVLGKWIKNYDNIVFFGGAGVSTESGIPDFRSVDGLYNQKYDYPPETILSHDFFCGNVSEFYRFYKDKMLCLDVKPNKAHLALARLEKCGKLKAVVTQNIDGLHQAAGSKNVFELHGSVHRNYCVSCGREFDALYIKNDLLIVGGTSLAVYPANGLINYFKGEKIAMINKSPTDYDDKVDLLISDGIGGVLDKACEIAEIQ